MNTILSNSMAKSINKATRVAELSDLVSSICSKYRSCNIEDERLQRIMDTLADYDARLSVALLRERTQRSLKNLDQERITCYYGVVRLTEAYAVMRDDAVAEHWNAIKPVMDGLLPSITGGNYKSRTALVTTLLDKVMESEMAVHVAALPGLTVALDGLRSAQDAFLAKRTENQALSQKAKVESASQVKALILPHVSNKLLSYLRAMIDDDAAAYGEFASLVNELVIANNVMVRNRHRKKGTASDEVLQQ